MRSIFIKLFLPLCVALSLVTALVLLLIFDLDERSEVQKIEISETTTLANMTELLQLEFSHIIEDLYALNDHHELKKYLLQASPEVIVDLQTDWGSFVTRRKVYDQIRLLDTLGQERIRLNYVDGTVVAVSEDRLQDKSKRYYFRDTLALGQGEVYVSALDLNVENGRVEEPYKPMIRFGKPVFDGEGERSGVIILNVLAETFLKRLKNRMQGSASEFMLVNEQGYWLSHPVSEKEWGFILGHDERFSTGFPLAWQKCRSSDQGQFKTEDGLYTYTTIRPLASAWEGAALFVDNAGDISRKGQSYDYTWKLISHIPQSELEKSNDTLREWLVGLWAGLTGLYLVAARKLWQTMGDRNQAYLAVRNREETINLILNSTAEGIYGVDKAGICTFFNSAAQKYLGFSEQEMIGQKVHDRIAHTTEDGKLSSEDACRLRDVFNTGAPFYNDDAVLWEKNGDWLSVAYHIHPIENNGQVEGAVVTFVDISDKKKLIEQQIRSRQLSALGELAKGVGHEINNPISGVINYAQILLNKQNGNDGDKIILKNIIKEGDRIATIVQNLLRFAQKDNSEMHPISVEVIVHESVELVKQQLLNDGISLEVHLADDLHKIYGNEQKLQQVVLGLISNARHSLNEKYQVSSANKLLRISAAEVGEGDHARIRIIIMDQGNGIAKEKLKRVFNRFYTTKPAGVGTGLGLSIVHDILEEHNAIIEIESEGTLYTKVIMEFAVCN